MIQFYLSVLLIVIMCLLLFVNKEHFEACSSNISLNAHNYYDKHSKWSGINLIWDEESEKDVYVLIQDKSDDKPIVIKLDNMGISKNCTEDDTQTKQCYTLNSDTHSIHPYRTYIISLNIGGSDQQLLTSNSIQITTNNPKLSETNLNSNCGWNGPHKK